MLVARLLETAKQLFAWLFVLTTIYIQLDRKKENAI